MHAPASPIRTARPTLALGGGGGSIRLRSEHSLALLAPVETPLELGEATTPATATTGRSARSALRVSARNLARSEAPSLDPTMEASRRRLEFLRKRHEWYSRQAAKVAAKVRDDDDGGQDLIDRAQAALDGRAAFTALMDMISIREASYRQRVREQHAEWEKKVFEPIRDALDRAVDEAGDDAARRTLRLTQFQDFVIGPEEIRRRTTTLRRVPSRTKFCPPSEEELAATERPRETVVRPTSPASTAARDPSSPTAPLRVPVKIDDPLFRASDPKDVVSVKVTNRFADLRDMMDRRLWASGKVEATPHGRVVTEGVGRRQTPHRMPTAQRAFDHYEVPRGLEVTNAELPPIGKKFLPKKRFNPILSTFPDEAPTRGAEAASNE